MSRNHVGANRVRRAVSWRSLLVLLSALFLAACDDGAQVADTGEPAPGQDTYQMFCSSCHLTGSAGAPRLGDKRAWAPLAEKGIDELLARTITGVKPGMPKRGQCKQCTDEQLREAISYMLDRSR